ncbi:MAG: T9SS type A sorting domain-containing protein, partial [Bacteroidales bacterium]|nr:T9SS type A sorting domain-containing protein [Bacteroidales bacterium]
KDFPTTSSGGRNGVKNTLVNDNGEMILTGMFNNSIQFGNIQLIGGSNSNAYIVKYSSDSSFLVPFEGGDTLNDQKPISSFINEISLTNNQLIIYPNPTRDDIYIISTNERINSYSILNTNGQRIMNKENIKANKEKINLSNLPKGVYVIKVITDKNSYTRKVIRN